MTIYYTPLQDEETPVVYAKPYTRKWSCICLPHLESCYLAHFSPCHIIGTLGKNINESYNFVFIFYAFFYCSLCYAYYIFNYLDQQVCPKQSTDTCLLINNNCNNEYTHINGNYYPCYYNTEYNVCYPGESTCILIDNYNRAWKLFYILHFLSLCGLFVIHLGLRLKLRHKHKIKNTTCQDSIITMCLPTFSLAQLYREVLIDNEREIGINV